MSNPVRRPLRNLGIAAAAFVVLGWAPNLLHLPLDLQFDAALAVIYAFAILSLVLLTGYVGQVSLCQATFLGVGAYTSAWLFNVFHVNYLVAMAGAVAASFLLGVLIGIPALRLRGIMLAVVTLGVALVFDRYFFTDHTYDWFTGGAAGWRVDGTVIARVPMDWIDHEVNVFRFGLLLLLVVAVLVVNIHDSGSGRRFRAIRDSELAAATMGVDLTRYKLLAFGLAAAIAGLGGSLFPLASGQVSAQPFNVFYSLQFAAFAVLMGVRFVPAAVLGGFFGAFVPTLLGRWHPFNLELRYDWFQIALGALLVAQLIAAPDGVWGDLRHRVAEVRRRGAHRREVKPEAATA
jgi:ABC-type branched-subunit amino acid transport system permease subunit